MFRSLSLHSGSFLRRNGPLFYFFLWMVPALLSAQTGTVTNVRVEAGTEYFDIFRQTSDRAATKVFAATTYAGISHRTDSDSISLFVRSSKEYGTLRQQNSLFSISSETVNRTMTAEYGGRWKFFSYALMLGYNLDVAAGSALYGGRCAAAPWGEILSFSLSVKRSPVHNSTGILFQDFFVPFGNTLPSTDLVSGISFRPAENLSAEISYGRTVSSGNASRSGYGARHEYSGDKLGVRFRMQPHNTSQIEIFADGILTTVDGTLTKDHQSFGSIAGSQWRNHDVGVEWRTVGFALPLTFRYSFHELFVSGSGEIESWPFTSLAASVISNRLYYNLSGSAKYHSAVVAAGFTFTGMAVNVEVEYDKVLPDITLEHWEPEFLVFGMKNFVRNPFSISTAHLAKIHTSLSRSFSSVTIRLTAEQYFPLAITYRNFESTGILPGPPAAPSQKPVSDGGRRIGLSCSFYF